MARKPIIPLGIGTLTCFAMSCVALTTQAKAGSQTAEQQGANSRFRGVAIRYQVKDAERAATFYTRHLGFASKLPPSKAFAAVTNGILTLYLSGPGSSGARSLPDGRAQSPGGWNRIVLEVTDLPELVALLKKDGLRFRNEIETGPGGKQIQLEDPDGNPVELSEPAR